MHGDSICVSIVMEGKPVMAGEVFRRAKKKGYMPDALIKQVMGPQVPPHL